MIRKDEKTTRVPHAEVAKGINQGLEQADPLRLEGLTRLQRVREIKAASLTREQARLSQKLGANHPRVTALAQNLDVNRALLRDVDLGITRAQTAGVKPDPDSWILHGHVRNKDRAGLPGLTVALYDARNQWVEELGYACTDANGYFRLSAGRGNAAPKETAEAGTDVKAVRDAKEAPEASKGAVADMQTARGVHIHVLDGNRKTLYRGEEALEPALGEVVYREIILDDCGDCAPPDGKPGPAPQPETDAGKGGRYLGNRSTRELHDLNNKKTNCRIGSIKAAQREYFDDPAKAIRAGYDFCAYCFGKDKSKR